MQRSSLKLTLLILVATASLGSMMHRSAEAATKEVVSFRLTEWKSVHMDDQKKAEGIIKTLKKIGCDATGHSHGDHFDIRYRCVNWRSISLESHAKAHEWETWLKKLKFETKHQH